MPYVDVAVNAAVPYRTPFTYAVPPGMELQVGHAVYVPFGRRLLQGVVLAVSDTPSYPETRDVQALIDSRPLVSPQRAALACWIARRYQSSLFAAVALMLPPGFQRRPLTLLQALVSAEEVLDLDLTAPQRQVLERVLARGRAELEEVTAGGKGLRAAVEQLERRGLLARSYGLARPRVGPKLVTHVRLLLPFQEAVALARELSWRRPEVITAALRLLAEEGPSLPLSHLRTHTALSLEQVRRLAGRGILALERVVQQRDPLADYTVVPDEPPPLTDRQRAALTRIRQALTEAVALGPQMPSRTFLLHGVTGSGKTEVYLRALAEAVALGRRGIVLVPEIALTPQTVRRFAQRFPGRVAVLHSGLSQGELYDQWHRIRDGHYVVVIGPRGALFAPQPDLGLIVIDEEHETTYKQQEPAPRYHARAVAEKLAELTGAVLVLGSATPDLESYYQATTGRYCLLELPQRISPGGGSPTLALHRPLPAVQVVDMRQELKAGNTGIFSRSLQAAIAEALTAGEQVILFLNRRGTAAFIQCRDCGHVPRCSGCGLSLTYHAAQERLLCHHCHRQRRSPPRCPQCGSPHLRQFGAGTQRVEQEAARLFRGARLLRWDRDVTGGRGAHERILSRFLDREADILIGTQMVAKGLDLPAVTLVGVISADVTLNLPDYRSGERTFQLLTQVAGRAGRGPRGGHVIIQTYTPDHYAVQAAAGHDYRAFYQRELEWRHRYGYPPFASLARLIYAHSGPSYAAAEAQRVARLLRQRRDALGLPNLDVRGPAPAYLPRLRGRYRWQILLRGDAAVELLAQVNLPQGWTVDVDPVSLL